MIVNIGVVFIDLDSVLEALHCLRIVTLLHVHARKLH